MRMKPTKLAVAVLQAIWRHHNPNHAPYGLHPVA